MLVVLPLGFAIGVRYVMSQLRESLMGSAPAPGSPMPGAGPRKPDDGRHFVMVRRDGLKYHVPDHWMVFVGWPNPQPTTKPLNAFATETGDAKLAVFRLDPVQMIDEAIAGARLRTLYPTAKLESLSKIPSKDVPTFEARMTWAGDRPFRGYIVLKGSVAYTVAMVFTTGPDSFDRHLETFKASARTLVPPSAVQVSVEAEGDGLTTAPSTAN